jgi:CheY-like chemotaxis protein
LIAEDNEINALLARSALAKSGHRVEVVSNGKAALAALTEPSRHFDVVLMDLHMPVMDGLDAISNLRRYEDDHGIPPIPVLVLSADGQDDTRQSLLTHGARTRRSLALLACLGRRPASSAAHESCETDTVPLLSFKCRSA